MSNTGPSHAKRRKVHWMTSRRNLETVRNWDRAFPIGTKCIHNGVETYTESHAAQDNYGEPVVFIHGVEEPVMLIALTVPGFVVKPIRAHGCAEPHV